MTSSIVHGRRLGRISAAWAGLSILLALVVFADARVGHGHATAAFVGAAVAALFATIAGVRAVRRRGGAYAWLGLIVGAAVFLAAASFVALLVWAFTRPGAYE